MGPRGSLASFVWSCARLKRLDEGGEGGESGRGFITEGEDSGGWLQHCVRCCGSRHCWGCGWRFYLFIYNCRVTLLKKTSFRILWRPSVANSKHSVIRRAAIFCICIQVRLDTYRRSPRKHSALPTTYHCCLSNMRDRKHEKATSVAS